MNLGFLFKNRRIRKRICFQTIINDIFSGLKYSKNMILKPYGEAIWEGPVIEGSGKIKTKSNILENVSYSFVSRTNENIPGQTNPEELIAAAHSACYCMYLSLLLTQKGYTVSSLHTKAQVKLRHTYEDLAIEEIHLSVEAAVPGISSEELLELAEVSKFKCPVSKALAVIPILLTEVSLINEQ